MATKTKNNKTKTTTRKRSTRKRATTPDAKLRALAKRVAKDPAAATVEQRRAVVEAGLVVAGLKGKARKLYIEKGEEPRTTVARARAAKPKRSRKASASRPMPIHEAIQSALAEGPMEQAALVERVSELRGKDTATGTVRPYLTDPNHSLYRQHKSGKWALSR